MMLLPPVGVLFNDLPFEEVRSQPWAMFTPFAYALFALWNLAFAAGAIKRCHDRGRSGWFLLLYYIPALSAFCSSGIGLDDLPIGFSIALGLFVNVPVSWVFVELAFLPGTRGPNRFGPDPLRGTT